MRYAIAGLLVLLGLVALATMVRSPWGAVYAQPPTDQRPELKTPAGQLIALSSPAAEGRQQVVVIDPRLRSMSVYHIESATGEIALKSVRRFHWDLEMEEFNGQRPLPREIRAMLEQR